MSMTLNLFVQAPFHVCPFPRGVPRSPRVFSEEFGVLRPRILARALYLDRKSHRLGAKMVVSEKSEKSRMNQRLRCIIRYNSA
jgi:hypothetical protein